MNTTKSYHFAQVFIAACVGMLLFGIVMLTLGSILPEVIVKYDLDDLKAGSLASLLPTGILVGSFIFGPIVDRYSYKYLLVFCSMGIAIGMYGIAHATGLFMLQTSFLMIGFGGGALNGGTNALVADISKDHGKSGSANLSLLGVFFGVGALVVPTIMALLSKTWSYEGILTGVAGVIFIPTLFFLLIKFPIPKQSQSLSLSSSFALFKSRPLLFLAFMLFFESAFEGVFNNWTTTFLSRARDFSEPEALTILSVYIMGLTVTRLFLAGLLKMVSPRSTLYLSILSLLLGSLMIMLFEESTVIFLAAVILGVGTAAIFPVILGYVSEMYEELRGAAFGVVIFIAVAGNILVNFLMGILAEFYGIRLYPWVLSICILLILLIFLVGGRTVDRAIRNKG